MRILLTGAAVLAVFAISAPLASAESTGVVGAVEGQVEIVHVTESVTGTDPTITVSQNACLEHQRHLDVTDCRGVDLAPPVEVVIGPPKGTGPPPETGPPLETGPGEGTLSSLS